MATNYPVSLDDNTTLKSDNAADEVITSANANNVGGAIKAVETKVGTGASTPTTTGHVLTVTGAGASAWQAPSGGGGGGSSIVHSEVIAADAASWTSPALDLDADGGVYQIDIAFRFKSGLVSRFRVNGNDVSTRFIKGTGASPTGNTGTLTSNVGEGVGYMSIRIAKPVGFGFVGNYTVSGAGSHIEVGSFASSNAYSGDENVTSVGLTTPGGTHAVTEGTLIVISKVV